MFSLFGFATPYVHVTADNPVALELVMQWVDHAAHEFESRTIFLSHVRLEVVFN